MGLHMKPSIRLACWFWICLISSFQAWADTTITLEHPVHFLSPGGEDLLVEPGTYEVEAAEEWLRLVAGERRDALLVAAEKRTHEDQLDEPIALSVPGEVEDQHHVLLLLPDGTSLEAIGSYSGVRQRGINRRVLSIMRRQAYLAKKRAAANRARRQLPNRLSAVAPTRPPVSPNTPVTSDLKYNDVRQKSSHNAYEKKEAIFDQMVYHRIRSLEFDIQTHKDGFKKWKRRRGNWYVFHDDVREGTTCHRLSDCLDELRAFHHAVPEHEVVTVVIDLKDGWEPHRQPQDLDRLILSRMPRSWIVSPRTVLDACPQARTTLQLAINRCGWPTLRDLRGKFLFILTGGTIQQSKLKPYAGSTSQANQRVAFAAPDVSEESEIRRNANVIFFNLQAGAQAHSLAHTIHTDYGYVSRMWKINSKDEWEKAEQSFVHHLATDKVNFEQDRWSRTHNDHGWPFACFAPCQEKRMKERGHVFSVRVSSGDIWGKSDSFAFRYLNNAIPGRYSWHVAVSTPNSHTESWAKACLMARATTAAGSPYFAVCRPADGHPLRIQYRYGQGKGTGYATSSIVPDDTIDPESLAYVKLEVIHRGRSSCAQGFGSQDGRSWKPIGRPHCFGRLLRLQGLATSSHDADGVRFLYVGLHRNGKVFPASLLSSSAKIGGARSGISSANFYDGAEMTARANRLQEQFIKRLR